MINTLIDTPDRRELIKAQIGALLKAELVNQQALAVTAAKDPAPWNIRVFVGASAPWSAYQNPEDSSNFDDRAIINVTLDDTNPVGASSTVIEQSYKGVFDLDCVAYAASESTLTGHIPADRAASLRVDTVVTIIRKIIMVQEYESLGLGYPIVQGRRIRYITPRDFEDPNAIQNFKVTRLSLEVDYTEVAPENAPEILEITSIGMTINPQGEVIPLIYNY